MSTFAVYSVHLQTRCETLHGIPKHRLPHLFRIENVKWWPRHRCRFGWVTLYGNITQYCWSLRLFVKHEFSLWVCAYMGNPFHWLWESLAVGVMMFHWKPVSKRCVVASHLRHPVPPRVLTNGTCTTYIRNNSSNLNMKNIRLYVVHAMESQHVFHPLFVYVIAVVDPWFRLPTPFFLCHVQDF